MRFLVSFVIFLWLFSPLVQAKLFQNSYISFEIPQDWECKAFGTDWVCHSQFQEKKVEAIITSTAKIAGPSDTRAAYLKYLQRPKLWANQKGEEIRSEKVTMASEVFINKFPWVDVIHKNSEVKSYISRYVGTVCCPDSSSQLGILVVLSAHQDHYTKYSGSFVQTVNSLKVLDVEKAIPKVRSAQTNMAPTEMSKYMDGLFDEGGDSSKGDNTGSGPLGLDPVEWGVAGGGLLSTLAYFLFKRRKKRALKRRSRRRRRR